MIRNLPGEIGTTGEIGITGISGLKPRRGTIGITGLRQHPGTIGVIGARYRFRGVIGARRSYLSASWGNAVVPRSPAPNRSQAAAGPHVPTAPSHTSTAPIIQQPRVPSGNVSQAAPVRPIAPGRPAGGSATQTVVLAPAPGSHPAGIPAIHPPVSSSGGLNSQPRPLQIRNHPVRPATPVVAPSQSPAVPLTNPVAGRPTPTQPTTPVATGPQPPAVPPVHPVPGRPTPGLQTRPVATVRSLWERAPVGRSQAGRRVDYRWIQPAESQAAGPTVSAVMHYPNGAVRA
jgi:hypothetical protein